MVRASFLALAALLLFPASPAAADDLSERLDDALGVRALRGARVGVLVVRADDGKVLFERAPDQPMIPASNMKVLTALAALSTFGPTHRFTTAVYADAAPDEEGSVGTLYVRGGGDPGLTSEQMWKLASELRRQGVRKVTGDLVLDDSVFDRTRWHSSWGRISSRAYHAPVGGLTVNYAAFSVHVEAGKSAGDPLGVSLEPPVDYLRLVNRGRTVGPRSRDSLRVARRTTPEGLEVVVSGALPAGGGRRVIYRSVADPVRYAGSVLRLQLEAQGVQVAGGTRLERVPPEAPLLLAFAGPTLAEIVTRFLKYSNNMIAEALVKAMGARMSGAPGSWEQGVLALREQLVAAEVPLEALELVDGSGLSYANRLTPRSLVAALLYARDSFEVGPELIAALPIAARDGTLRRRGKGASDRVRAKTGLLTRVTSLSGLAESENGESYVFSILVNGYRSGDREAMNAIDGFLEVLVRDRDVVAEGGSAAR